MRGSHGAGGVVFYPFAKAKEYLRFYSDFSRQIPLS